MFQWIIAYRYPTDKEYVFLHRSETGKGILDREDGGSHIWQGLVLNGSYRKSVLSKDRYNKDLYFLMKTRCRGERERRGGSRTTPAQQVKRM
jgi:hypothetical protein